MRSLHAEVLWSIILQHVSHLLINTWSVHLLLQMLSFMCYFSTPSFHKFLPICTSVYALQKSCKNVPTNSFLATLASCCSNSPLPYSCHTGGNHTISLKNHALSGFLTNHSNVLRQQTSKKPSAWVLYQEQSVRTSTPESTVRKKKKKKK